VINKIFLSFISAITIILLISCNDSPTDLGAGYLNQDGVILSKFDTSVDSMPQFSRNFKNVFSLGGSDQLLIGKAENITAHALIKFIFAIPDSIKSELLARNLTVIDSWVELIKDYKFGDSAATFDYQVFKINSSWTSSKFTSDSLSVLSYDNTDLSFNRTTENDTVYSFHIDTTLTSSWLQNYVDTTVASNYGILISPTSNTQKVLGFTAFNTSGVDDPRLRIVVQKAGEYIDTLIGYVTTDISAVIGDLPNVGTENLAIQSSLTSEVKLFFDLSVLPKNITINSAVLTLTVDTSQTKTGSNFTNSLRVFLLDDSSKNELNTNYIYTLKRSAATYTGEITNILRVWNNNVSNEGMLIKASSELRGIEIFAIKGSNAAEISKRPKLEIVYSRKK
jgi:hypothetical protein